MTDLAELKRLAEAARSTNKQSGYDALARACTASTILSLIQRVEEAEAHVVRLQSAVGGASNAAWAQGRLAGIEEAAKVADAERSVGWEAAAQMESEWDGAAKTIAQAIRALKERQND